MDVSHDRLIRVYVVWKFNSSKYITIFLRCMVLKEIWIPNKRICRVLVDLDWPVIDRVAITEGIFILQCLYAFIHNEKFCIAKIIVFSSAVYSFYSFACFHRKVRNKMLFQGFLCFSRCSHFYTSCILGLCLFTCFNIVLFYLYKK